MICLRKLLYITNTAAHVRLTVRGVCDVTLRRGSPPFCVLKTGKIVMNECAEMPLPSARIGFA